MFECLESRIVLDGAIGIDLTATIVAYEMAMTQGTLPMPVLTGQYEQIAQMAALGLIPSTSLNAGSPPPPNPGIYDYIGNALTDMYMQYSGVQNPIVKQTYYDWWQNMMLEMTSANRPITYP